MAHPSMPHSSGLVEDVADGRLSPARAFAMLSGRVADRSTPPQDGAGPILHSPVPGATREADGIALVLAELDALVGLDHVKRAVREIRAYVEVQKRRQAAGLGSDRLVLHMAFKGNPGTGKTTVARLVGRMFKHLGVLAKGHTVEVERADLVGEYVGHTAQRTREQIRKAIGGLLFIDEAYSLARGGEKDFGKEAVDALVKAMEDHRHEMVVIMAGYRHEMDLFLRLNPGLLSRTPFVIDFPDYSNEELIMIADQMVRERDYRLTPEARERLALLLLGHRLCEFEHFGNARLLRNVLEAAFRRQALRLHGRSQLSKEDLMLVQAADIPVAPDPA